MEDSYLGMPLYNQNSKNTFNVCQVHVSSSILTWFMHVRVTDSLWLTTILLCSNAPTNEARTIEFKFEFEFG